MGSYSNTPVEKDDFTRTLVSLFNDQDLIGNPQGGQSLFGNPAGGSQTVYSRDKNVVEIAIMRGNDRLAAMVPRGSVPGMDISTTKLVETKQSVFQRVYPLIEDEYPIRADQLLFQIPGETDEAKITREDRMAYLANLGAIEMQRRIGRLYEYLAWQSLVTGKQPAIIGTSDSNLQYDFLRPSGHIVDVGTVWGTGTPMADISAGVTVVRRSAHVTPDYCVMAPDSWAQLLANVALVAIAENPEYKLVQMDPRSEVPPKYKRLVDNGFLPVGYIYATTGALIYLFLYADEYTNSSDTVAPYLPSGFALLGFTGARADRYFGPPEVMPMGPSTKADFKSLFGFSLDSPPVALNNKPGNVFDPNSVTYDAYPEGTNKGWVIRAQAAPIFATTMTDAFYTMYNCHE